MKHYPPRKLGTSLITVAISPAVASSRNNSLKSPKTNFLQSLFPKTMHQRRKPSLVFPLSFPPSWAAAWLRTSQSSVSCTEMPHDIEESAQSSSEQPSRPLVSTFPTPLLALWVALPDPISSAAICSICRGLAGNPSLNASS